MRNFIGNFLNLFYLGFLFFAFIMFGTFMTLSRWFYQNTDANVFVATFLAMGFTVCMTVIVMTLYRFFKGLYKNAHLLDEQNHQLVIERFDPCPPTPTDVDVNDRTRSDF